MDPAVGEFAGEEFARKKVMLKSLLTGILHKKLFLFYLDLFLLIRTIFFVLRLTNKIIGDMMVPSGRALGFL